MIGQFDQAMGAGAASGTDLKNKWIPAWNSIILTEPKNFKIKEAFHKDDVFYDVVATEKLNANINSEELMSIYRKRKLNLRFILVRQAHHRRIK